MKRKLIIILVIFIGLGFLGLAGYHFFKSRISADIATVPLSYTIFSKPTFDYVMADSQPEESEIIKPGGSLTTFAAQGEIEPVTFSVRSDKYLGEVILELSDLRSGQGRIPQKDIELKNIKIWPQCRTQDHRHCDQARDKKEIPELLVADNEQDLVAEEPGWNESEKRYYPPTLNKEFRAKIDKDKTHTFYLRIRVPDNAPAGRYRGKIKFYPQDDPDQFQEIRLNLEVLPFQLPESKKEHLVYFMKTISWNWQPERQLSKELYQRYLDLFKESGITGIVSPVTEESLPWVVSQLKARGFNRSFIWMPPWNYYQDQAKLKAGLALIKKNGLEPYLYGIDEPNQPSKMKQNLEFVKEIHQAGGQASTSIWKECAEAMADPDFPIYDQLEDVEPTESLDLPIYGGMVGNFDCCNYQEPARESFEEYTTNLIMGSEKKSAAKEFYYHQLWEERIHFSRAFFGFFLWNNSLDGVVPYGVQSHYVGKNNNWHGLKFYDDFDAPVKEHNTIYPSTDGPVLTLQWESFREGIDDVRYLTKYDQLLDQLSQNDNNKARELRDQLKKKLAVYSFYGDDGRQPWRAAYSDTHYQKTREYLAQKIEEVNSLLNPNPPGRDRTEEEELPARLIETGGEEGNLGYQWWLFGSIGLATILAGLILIRVGRQG